jgi:hypothetical protein
MLRACEVFNYNRHPVDAAAGDCWISVTTVREDDDDLCASPAMCDDVVQAIRRWIDLNLNSRLSSDVIVVDDNERLFSPETIARWIYRLAARSLTEYGGTPGLTVQSVRVCTSIHRWIEYQPDTTKTA